MDTTNNETKLSAIDRALAAAKARKAMKDADTETADPPAAKEPKAKKSTEPTFAKQQKKEALAAARQAAKAIRDAERQKRRDIKLAEKTSSKPAHMKKVEKAAGALPRLSGDPVRIFEEVTSNFGRDQIAALALHLQHFNRVRATERALNQRLEAGTAVRITGGDPKYIGMSGTINKAQRIRCYVDVPGVKKPVYLFTSDVEQVGGPEATGSEG